MKWGVAVTPTSGQTYAQAISAYETLVGATLPMRRAYDGAPPSSIGASQLNVDVGTGRKVVYSIKPTITTSIVTMDSLAQGIANSGLDVDVAIYHEPVDNMTGSDFIALYQRSAPSFRNLGIPVGVIYTNYSCNLPYGNAQSALHAYWPGASVVDWVGIDEYPINEITSTKDALPMDQRTRRVCQFVDALGKPLILCEYGVDAAWDVVKSDRWLRSVLDWARQRRQLYRPVDLLYFSIADSAGAWDYRLGSHTEYIDAIKDMIGVI